ncbi:photosystem II 10 kDa polypeptide, chloroplastic [Selaginella moellendorffii]|uniref:photosystem II 10 kDa polypeptide, chloroplastic n=1 Tax=Selaginella moellendorffii TaxID=88036 RepID=UPI000D1C7537|nr:photosystem II 10 kDa polypeptide, chloroplastic [Selaginella moellendorffii]|eukprot:XP_024533206.1 photosystem II 10 kDa polypeptide, chloroplastic [Selaginella moellendorffii]
MAAVLERSAFCGSSLARAPVAARGLPALSTRLTVTARGGKKISTKAPLGEGRVPIHEEIRGQCGRIQTGLLLWAITLGGVLLAGVFLVYSTSALAS